MTTDAIQAKLKTAYDAGEEHFQCWLGELFRGLSLEDVPILYQYTTLAGLKGMISEKELWATNLAYCNDASEFKYGVKQFIKVIKARGTPTTSSVENKIADDLVARLEALDRSDTFISCLTAQGDQLSQWRGYGDQGYGYSIGFDFTAVRHLRGVATCAWVLYDDADHAELCQKSSADVVNALVQCLTSEEAESAADDIAAMVMADISGSLPYLKHPAFQEEGEYRLFSSVAELAQHQNIHDFPVHVREGRNMLVPYVKLTTPRNGATSLPLPIREIVVGPKVDFEKVKPSIRLLLKNCGYPEDIEIKRSEIPFV